MTKTAGKLPATLIPGDGIGPEIMKSAVDILEALGHDQVLRQDGIRTPDLGGKASTTDFTQSIIRRINQ
jgi:isocitrate/isopropylmalate dehydrogenase